MIIPLTGLLLNSSYSVSIRGKRTDGTFTEWSKFQTFTTVSDNIAPSTPSKPTVTSGTPQNVIISHDLTKNGGGNLDKDIRYFEVYISDSRDSYATETYVGNIPVGPLAAGSVSQSFFYPLPSNDPAYPSGITTKARVKAVDASGNKSSFSPISDASTSIPFFSAAYITNLTVGTLSADDITTGTLQAGVAISVGTTTPIVIKSNSTSPHGQMYLGTGTYNNVNTPFYVDSTNKFSLGTGLTWDGSTLTVNGSGTFAGTVNASGGTFSGAVSAGASKFGVAAFSYNSVNNNGLSINASNYWGINASNKAVFAVGDATNYVLWDGTVASPQLSIKGNVVATGGSITGRLTVGDTYIGPGITLTGGTGGTNSGIVIDSSGYNYFVNNGSGGRFQVGSATSYVKWDGSTLTVRGDVAATSVSAGASISSPTITGGTITIGSGNAVFKADSNGIYLGNATFSSAPFRVDTAGALTASNVSITGGSITITSGSTQTSISSGQLTTNFISATGGFVGGWAVGTSSLGAGSNILYSSPSSGYSQIVTGNIKTSTYFESDNASTSGTAGTVLYSTGLGDGRFFVTGTRGVVSAGWFGGTGDNAYPLGGSGRRWTAVWAANGTIQTSDVRTKNTIEDEVYGLNFIEKLRPVSFKMNIGGHDVEKVLVDGVPDEIYTPIPGKRHHHGFIAQEVKEVLDELGLVDFGGWVKENMDDPDAPQSLRYDQFIAPLTKAVQELYQMNKDLEARIAALE